MVRIALRVSGWTLGLALTVWIAGLGMQWLAVRYDPYEQLLAQMFQPDQNYDYIVLGNSTANLSVNPEAIDRELGLRGFNLALGGANFLTNELCLREYLRHNKPPGLALIGIHVNRPEESLDLRASLWRFWSPKTRREAVEQLEASGANPPSAPLRSGYRHLPLLAYRSCLPIVARVAVRGEQFVPRIIAGHLAYDFAARSTLDATISPHDGGIDFEALAALVATCREHQIDVVLFEPPCWPASNRACANRIELLRQVHAFADAHSVRWISMNSAALLAQLPAETWLNLDHLNADGALVCSAALARRLNTVGGE